MRAFLQDVAALAAFDPSARYAIKAAKYARKMAGLTGVDLTVTRDEAEIAMEAENAAKAEAALMAMQGSPEGPLTPDNGMVNRDALAGV